MNFGHGYRPSRSKYGAKKVHANGMTFDSKAEYERWLQLKQMQREGKIAGLDRQVKYELTREHREPDTIGPKGGRRKGKIIEKARYYVADFVYYDSETAELVVEDKKGFKTPEYKLKKAIMLDKYGIRIKET